MKVEGRMAGETAVSEMERVTLRRVDMCAGLMHAR